MVQYLGKSNTYAAVVHSDCLMPSVVIVYVCLCLDKCCIFLCTHVHCHNLAVYIYRLAMQIQQRQWPGSQARCSRWTTAWSCRDWWGVYMLIGRVIELQLASTVWLRSAKLHFIQQLLHPHLSKGFLLWRNVLSVAAIYTLPEKVVLIC